MIRTFDHAEVQEMAEYATIPVINGLTDLLHPCQVMADLQTIQEEFGTDLEGISVAWFGDGNNMANSWLNAARVFGLDLRLACPEGYDPDPEILSLARESATITLTRDPAEAADGANVLTTDVWASMGQEDEAEGRKEIFRPYQVTEELMRLGHPEAIFLHCLPAHRGEEVTAEVIDGPQSRSFRRSREPPARPESHHGGADGLKLVRILRKELPMGDALKKTPLYEAHVALGGKLVPFAGFEMPVQYPAGITAEHHAVRTSAGLFDVCHMGEFVLRGPQALELIQKITVNDASKIDVWQAQYSAMCLESGGIIDDLLVYRGPDHFMLVVNASNKAKDLAWVLEHAPSFDVDVTDKSDDTALLAIQGPGQPRFSRGSPTRSWRRSGTTGLPWEPWPASKASSAVRATPVRTGSSSTSLRVRE